MGDGVKAAARVIGADLRGLTKLRGLLGDAFTAGATVSGFANRPFRSSSLGCFGVPL